MADAGVMVLEQLLENSRGVGSCCGEDAGLGVGVDLATGVTPGCNVASLDLEIENCEGEDCKYAQESADIGEKETVLPFGNFENFEVPSAGMSDEVCEGENCKYGQESEDIGEEETVLPFAGMSDEVCDFPCLSPLLLPTGDEIGNSLCLVAGPETCGANLCSGNKDPKECEDSDKLLELDYSLMNNQADGSSVVSTLSSNVYEPDRLNGKCNGVFPLGSKDLSFESSEIVSTGGVEQRQLRCMDFSEETLAKQSAAENDPALIAACSKKLEIDSNFEVVDKEEIQPVSESYISCERLDKAAQCTIKEDFTPQQCLSTLADNHTFQQTSSCKEDAASSFSSIQASKKSNGDTCDLSSSTEAGIKKAESILIYKRCNPKRAASLRNTSSVSKLNTTTSPKNVRKSKNVMDSESQSNNFLYSLKMTSRKKSSHRTSRASVWGKVETLYAMFSLTNNSNNCSTELNPTKQDVQNARCIMQRKRKSKGVGHGSNVDSSRQARTSAFPTNCFPSSNNKVVTDASFDGCNPTQFPHHHGALLDPATSFGRDDHCEKNMGSNVKREISNEENHLGGILSGPVYKSFELDDDKLTNPSTSPESDVIHPMTEVRISVNDFNTLNGTQFCDALNTSQLIPNPSVEDSDVHSILNAKISEPHPCLQQHVKHQKVKKTRVQKSLCQPSEFAKKEKATNASKPARRSGTNVRSKCDGKHANGKGTIKSSEKGLHQTEFPLEKTLFEESELLNRKAQKSRTTKKGTTSTEFASNVGIAGKISHMPASLRSKENGEGTKKVRSSSFKKKIEKKELLGHLAVEQDSKVLGFYTKENGEPSSLLETGDAYLLSGTTEPNDSNLTRDIDGYNAGNEIPSHKSHGIHLPKDEKVLENTLGLELQFLPPQVGWVCCDLCNKWRCIPSELIDIIKETNCKWTCKENNDKAFADCHIPQEKTNAEINAELEISDASGDDEFHNSQQISKRCDPAKPSAVPQSSWKRIKSNLFLHRNRKTQNIDEVMVCFCKPPREGGMGCGDKCLNRMLNIECVRGTCPCGDLCSNQQFQKRKYAKLKLLPCGKKGHGLQLHENVSEGQFLIEYVGEVLDMVAYEARQKEYASRGQRHFYFMTLNGSEVIDACMKGNLGRFVNHSCEPNCRTEKWMVNGEICIGLFAVRDIKKGEELTFDYNYVRVFGAAAKKCVCGSAECRGYIGGDPLNTDQIVQDYSDEEYLEPMLAHEDAQREVNMDNMSLDVIDIIARQPKDSEIKPDIEKTTDGKVDDISTENKGILQQHVDPVPKSSPSKSGLESDMEALGLSCASLDGGKKQDVLQIPKFSSEIVTDAFTDNKSTLKNLINVNYINDPKQCLTKKSFAPAGPLKKVRSKFVSQRAKKILGGSRHSNNFDGVAEKLNELIGSDGGISKKKDAGKGYLKLLFVTAADNIGTETIQSQSTRDLSLILDALLKTKSRAVLMDIINKNGWQMLHNIIKQNRKNTSKTPILRKLLKVLNYLVNKKIITQERINMIPSCAGVESFQNSIIYLTHHNDKEVQHAAREFREKWIVRATRKANISEMDSRQGPFYDSQSKNVKSSTFSQASQCNHRQVAREDDALPCITETDHLPSAPSSIVAAPETSAPETSAPETSAPSQESTNAIPSVHAGLTTGNKSRKRKSRWDQDKPPDKIKSHKCLDSHGNITSQASLAFNKQDLSSSQHENQNDSMLQDINEVPPGFGSISQCTSFTSRIIQSQSALPFGEVFIGKRQERYLSHVGVSHGIPLALVQQLGRPDEDGKNKCFPTWKVAPGMPFHPFPPLPPYPRERNQFTESQNKCASNHASNHSTFTRSSPKCSCSNQHINTPCQSHVSRKRSSEVASHGSSERGKQSSDVCEKNIFRREQYHNHGHIRSTSCPQERSGGGSRGYRRHEMHTSESLRKKIDGSVCATIGDAGTRISQQKHITNVGF